MTKEKAAMVVYWRPRKKLMIRFAIRGRVQLVEVELRQGRVEGQRREREVDVEQDEPDTQVVVDEEAGRFIDQADAHEELVERPLLAEEGLPGVGSPQGGRAARGE